MRCVLWRGRVGRLAAIVALMASPGCAPMRVDRAIDLSHGWLVDHSTLRGALGATSREFELPASRWLRVDRSRPGLGEGEMLYELANLPGGPETLDLRGATLRFELEVGQDLLEGPLTFVQPFVVTLNLDSETARQYGLARPLDYNRQRVTFKPSASKRWAHTDPGFQLDRATAVGLKVFAGSKIRRSYSGPLGIVGANLLLAEPRRVGAVAEPTQGSPRWAGDPHVPARCTAARAAPRPPAMAGTELHGEWRPRDLWDNAVTAQQVGASIWRGEIKFDDSSDTVAARTASLAFDLARGEAAPGRLIKVCVNVDPSLRGLGSRLNWVHLALEDERGRQMTGPGVVVSDEACRWHCVEVWASVGEPIPLGSSQPGFDPERVVRLVLKFELARFWAATGARPPIEGAMYVAAPFVQHLHPPINTARVPELPACAPGAPVVSRGDFTIGVNYPWVNYGWDVGRTPFDGRTTCGLSLRRGRLARDFQRLAGAGVDVVRFFLLADQITGVVFGPGNRALGLDPCVEPDVEALFEAASAAGVRLMPVLLDYTVADGRRRHEHPVARPRGATGDPRFPAPAGEHAALLTDPESQELFLQRVALPLFALLRRLAERHGTLHSLDLWNEPSNAKLGPGQFSRFKAFVRRLVAAARESMPNVALTLGARHLLDLRDHWADLDLDWQQVHFYDSFADEGLPNLDYAPACLGLTGERLLVGELDPTGDTSSKIEAAYRAGYAGVLLWSWKGGDGFALDLEPLRDWRGRP